MGREPTRAGTVAARARSGRGQPPGQTQGPRRPGAAPPVGRARPPPSDWSRPRSWTPRSGTCRRVSGSIGSTAGTVIDRAMATIAEGQSTWRPAELVRELAAAVPTSNGVEADRLVAWLDDTGRRGGGDALCRCVPPRAARCAAAPGRAAGHRVGHRSGAHHPSHPRPRSRPARLGRPPPGSCRRPITLTLPFRSNRRLHALQAEAAAAVAGYDDLVLIVGPGRDGQDDRPHPRGRAAPRRRSGRVRGRPLSRRGRRPQRRDRCRRPTRWTSCSSNTASTGHPIIATTSPSGPPSSSTKPG